jgi:hypothetical protein
MKSDVPSDTTTTIVVASQIGIDRHRIMTIPIAMPRPTAANFHGMPGDGAGYETSWFTQKRNTGDKVVPAGHRYRGIVNASNAPQLITTNACPMRHPSPPSGSIGRRAARTIAMQPMSTSAIPMLMSDPPHTMDTPHGPDEVNSPATQFTSSHADAMNSAPHASMQAATVT